MTASESSASSDATSKEPDELKKQDAKGEGKQKKAVRRAVCPKQDLDVSMESKFPMLKFTPFDPEDHCNPENVLGFFHNGAKLELCHLLTIVLPSLGTSVDVDKLSIWWSTLLRFLCFIADMDQDVSDLVIQQTTRHVDDPSESAQLVKAHKSLCDRYDFAMVHVFRAADRSFVQLCDALDNVTNRTAPNSGNDLTPNNNKNSTGDNLQETIDTARTKLASAARFMLNAMAACSALVQRARRSVTIDLFGIERKIVDKLGHFAASAGSCLSPGAMATDASNPAAAWEKASDATRRHVFLFMAAAWMADDTGAPLGQHSVDAEAQNEQRKWLSKFNTGISILSLPLPMLRRNNSAAYDQWKGEYTQHHGAFIRELLDTHPSSPLPPPGSYY